MEDRYPRQLPSHTWSALISYLHECGSEESPETVAEIAIADWIAQQQRRAAASPSAGSPGGERGRGYQWKGLFLPSGTKLRMWHGDQQHYAEVEDDDIIFEGRRVSPAQMVNTVAGNTRNAWRETWLLLPGETRWKVASLRRRQAQQLEERLALGPPAPPPPLPVVPAVEPREGQSLRQLANLLERALSDRQTPVYRRRTDSLGDIAFE
jgi:hypothetical protein